MKSGRHVNASVSQYVLRQSEGNIRLLVLCPQRANTGVLDWTLPQLLYDEVNAQPAL